MKFGKLKVYILIILFILNKFSAAEEKIETVPLINLENLSPTFEEEKDELEAIDNKNNILEETDTSLNTLQSEKKNKVYIHLTALDKITAKTSTFKMAVGDKKFFGPLEIKALKCQLSEENETSDDELGFLVP